MRERVRNDDDIRQIQIKRKPFTFQLFALIMVFSPSLFSLFLSPSFSLSLFLSFFFALSPLSLFISFSLSRYIFSLSLLFPNKTFVWVGKLFKEMRLGFSMF